MKIKNISPWGDLDIPLLRRSVAVDEEVDVSEDQARVLLAQATNFAPADGAAAAVADEVAAEVEAGIAAEHKERGLPAPGEAPADPVVPDPPAGDPPIDPTQVVRQVGDAPGSGSTENEGTDQS